ncbi:Na+/H+ antiporter subunit C [Fodinicurvata sp. EGI_FJ10296]|uniref:Na+/H+ antiporter subunit C n=1 Tax=Fodinicurvata sp. EGI_FJ10296 TaxID=3231908 RepID=UPI003451E104
MEIIFSLLTGVLIAASTYLMLGRNMIRFIFGLILLSNAANLILFTAGRLTWGIPPLVPDGMSVPDGPVSNALPQALILTAIVISFGLLAFAMVLVYRAYQELGTVDTDSMRVAEPETAPATAASAPIREPETRPAPMLEQETSHLTADRASDATPEGLHV